MKRRDFLTTSVLASLVLSNCGFFRTVSKPFTSQNNIFQQHCAEVINGDWSYFTGRVFRTPGQIVNLFTNVFSHMRKDRIQDIVNNPEKYRMPELNRDPGAESFSTDPSYYLIAVGAARAGYEGDHFRIERNIPGYDRYVDPVYKDMLELVD